MPIMLVKPKQGKRVNKSERDIFFYVDMVFNRCHGKDEIVTWHEKCMRAQRTKKLTGTFVRKSETRNIWLLIFVFSCKYLLFLVMLRHGDNVSYSNIWMENRGSEKYIFRFHEIKKSINWIKTIFWLKIELKEMTLFLLLQFYSMHFISDT